MEENIIKAMEYARKSRIVNVAFTGESGGRMKEFADVLINIPSNDTPRIQESHITIGHIICEIVESGLMPASDKDAISRIVDKTIG